MCVPGIRSDSSLRSDLPPQPRRARWDTFTFQSYNSCRGRAQIDLKLFQRVARELPPEYIPGITKLETAEAVVRHRGEMSDSSISLELCLWSSVPRLKMPEVHDLNVSDMCRRSAYKLLPELRKALWAIFLPILQASSAPRSRAAGAPDGIGRF